MFLVLFMLCNVLCGSDITINTQAAGFQLCTHKIITVDNNTIQSNPGILTIHEWDLSGNLINTIKKMVSIMEN